MRVAPVSWLLCLGILGSSSPVYSLAPRTPLAKEAILVHDGVEQRLIVKFVDALQVRAGGEGTLGSASGGNLASVAAVAAQHDLRFEQLISLPDTTLRFMEERAAVRSGVAQPDLAGIVIVHAPAGSSLGEIGESFQSLAEVEFAYLESLGEPPPTDLAPPTPNLVANQTYRPPNPGMDADYAWSAGATGAGVRLSDCEYGWNPTHEDLNELNLHLEPGQTIHPSVFLNGWHEHGTAVLGETSSDANAYGCSGMVPDADIYTWPEWTVEGGFRRATCIANAIASSGVGDVVLLEMQATGAGGDYGPAELDMAVWTLVKNGTDAGVIVVGAAGNGNQNLDSAPYAPYMGRGDSGAIIVGAGSSTVQHNKLNFSTYGSRVNVQGWGQNVFTLGYGDFAQYGGDANQRYTQGFNGTSSTSPFVASACVALQSLALATTGLPLTPVELRQLLIDTGWPQGFGGHIGPFPDMEAAIIEYFNAFASSISAQASPGTRPEAVTARPNPFRRSTEVSFVLTADEQVTLEVFDCTGRRVRGLLRDQNAAAGAHQATWDGRDDAGRPVASGLYFLRLHSRSHAATERVLVVR